MDARRQLRETFRRLCLIDPPAAVYSAVRAVTQYLHEAASADDSASDVTLDQLAAIEGWAVDVRPVLTSRSWLPCVPHLPLDMPAYVAIPHSRTLFHRAAVCALRLRGSASYTREQLATTHIRGTTTYLSPNQAQDVAEGLYRDVCVVTSPDAVQNEPHARVLLEHVLDTRWATPLPTREALLHAPRGVQVAWDYLMQHEDWDGMTSVADLIRAELVDPNEPTNRDLAPGIALTAVLRLAAVRNVGAEQLKQLLKN